MKNCYIYSANTSGNCVFKKKMSLNEFAFKILLLTSATQSRIENGLVDLKFSTLIKIANALNISPSELLDGFDFRFKP